MNEKDVIVIKDSGKFKVVVVLAQEETKEQAEKKGIELLSKLQKGQLLK